MAPWRPWTGRAGAPAAGEQARSARRLRQPSWRDGRLLVGLLLVLASVALGSRLVAAAQDTTAVYVATRDLGAGEALSAADLRPVQVRLGSLQGDYLPAGGLPGDRSHVVRSVARGELVPLSALGSRDQVAQRQVSVPVPAGSTGPLVRGTAVEVWVSRHSSEGGADVYAAPRLVVGNASVAREPEQSTSLTGGGSTVALQVWVPTATVPALLAAVDAKDRVTAVPLPGAVLRSGS
ncbi:SAF domain-containing protein [Arsenicicoccus dermatophilus]|uniref:SAF domain-containing protein n=1 Tax=Arsenicicoccus dermatophilus TaxID=1076331 RepID=UPI0039170D43